MSHAQINQAPRIALALLSCYLALPLLQHWQHSPYDRFGGPAFFIWLATLLWQSRTKPQRSHAGAAMFGIAIALALIGLILDINLILQLALASSLISLLARPLPMTLLTLSAVSWMPLLGYLLSGFGVNTALVNSLRITLALLPLLALLLINRQRA